MKIINKIACVGLVVGIALFASYRSHINKGIERLEAFEECGIDVNALSHEAQVELLAMSDEDAFRLCETSLRSQEILKEANAAIEEAITLIEAFERYQGE